MHQIQSRQLALAREHQTLALLRALSRQTRVRREQVQVHQTQEQREQVQARQTRGRREQVQVRQIQVRLAQVQVHQKQARVLVCQRKALVYSRRRQTR